MANPNSRNGSRLLLAEGIEQSISTIVVGDSRSSMHRGASVFELPSRIIDTTGFLSLLGAVLFP